MVMLLRDLLKFFLNLDEHLGSFIATYGAWTYAFIFIVIFLETGAVLTPFLPGDSLLFVAGTFSSSGGPLNPWALFFLLSAAAVAGDALNYTIGHLAGPRIFTHEDHWFFRKKNLERTRDFYEKYGAKTIILARFIPIIRTFAPFVAGIGGMSYGKFATYNIAGAVLWVGVAVWSGYFFGNLLWVKENFELVVIGVIVVSFLPPAVEWMRHRKKTAGSSGGNSPSGIERPPMYR